ncbi:hypothetical protein GCM10010307_69630 [Streptomyces vastus]|uniref:Aldehyde oxidase/xanthine dehydrogenase second molybdopterin binding domain-containing protein n=1 Tax=Streptomyces vastus TaxID=285451 RepID=A0ABP6E2Y9_9ACTN
MVLGEERPLARQWSRRKFVVYSLAASTLTVAAPLGCDAATAERAEPTAATTRRPSDVLVTGTDGEMLILEVTEANKVVVRLPRVEVGQGVTTAVAMMIAEELDARLADVDIPLADARAEGNQFTGGSSSVSSLYGPARALAALARAKLVTAAARRWNLPARSLRTRNTKVIAPDGRSATFGSLTASAARIRRPAVSSKPKPASRHRVIGRPVRTRARSGRRGFVWVRGRGRRCAGCVGWWRRRRGGPGAAARPGYGLSPRSGSRGPGAGSGR